MPPASRAVKRQWQAVLHIIGRNVFLLINGIIFAVVILLAIFGDAEEGVFLGLITVLNIVIGCVEEIHAWLALEKLQLLAAPRVVKLNGDGAESVVLVEDVREGDRIKLKTGDQVPCDGVLASSHGFAVSEALITGESLDILKKPGDEILAGSIVTSGLGALAVTKAFVDSRIALMTKRIKKYDLVQSPIQRSISLIIKYAGYALLIVILFVATRGLLVHESTIHIIQNIGALTSDLLPQGMVVIVTLFFSYGATYLYRRNVLLQEVNAAEKIGRIRNLCMDKTGTLTDNHFVIEHRHMAPGVAETYVAASIAAYIKSSGDLSENVLAMKQMFREVYAGDIVDFRPFSSSRQFGAVHIKDGMGERVVIAGAPDVLSPHFGTAEDVAWAQYYIATEASIGKRLICFAQSDANVVPDDLAGVKLSALAILTLHNNLREGVADAIRFFEARGVRIRIISGDSPRTVQAVAAAAGVSRVGSAVTGPALASWTEADFSNRARDYTVFAAVTPEQKEKIIESLRRDGFTAMIGDGANDALAVKKADLGIAMFDGAQATRQAAAVVLVKNSFADLPNGVRLADSIIQNTEMCASIFFNQVFLGLFFFIILAASGYAFPFTPLNLTFMNYFTIGLPGCLIFYWIVQPVRANVIRDDTSFLRRVIPFALVSAVPQALVAIFAFCVHLGEIKNSSPSSLIILAFVTVGVIFFMFTPDVYRGMTTRAERSQFFALAAIEIISFMFLIKIPIVQRFYNLDIPPLPGVIALVPVIMLYALVQYALVRWFFKMPEPFAKA